jgi:hypothetical protein
MKNNSIKISLLVMIMIVGLLSCKKDKPNDDAVADVYIKSILSDGVPVFGLVHTVVGYSAMSSVTVQSPSGVADQLNAYNSGKMIYYTEPSLTLGTYSDSQPESGEYSYGVTFEDGTEKVFTNELKDIYLLPPTINSIEKSIDNQNVIMSLAPLTGVEYYQLSVSKDGTVLNTSDLLLPPSGNNIVIPLTFIPYYTPGAYTFQLDAVIYESSSSNKLQALSTASLSADI